MKEETIKKIANVTGIVAGIAADLAVANLLSAHVSAKAVRGVVTNCVMSVGIEVVSWFVGCKVADHVSEFAIDTAHEIEDLKSDIKKKLNGGIDNTEENTKEVDFSENEDNNDESTEENTKEVDFSENEDNNDEGDVSPITYFEFAKYGDKDVAEKSLSRFIGHLRGFMAYDTVTGKVRHLLNLNELNPNEIYWVASLVNDFAQVVNVGDEWALFLPKPFNYRKWRGCEIHNV